MPSSNRKIRTGLLIGSIISFISIIIMLTGILGNFEFKAYDLFSRLLNPERSDGTIVIIEIDQPSIDLLNKEQSIDWPWPRQAYAAIIDYVSRSDAVLIDMFFTEPSFYGVEDDKAFGESMKRAGNVFIPVGLTNNRSSMSPVDDEFIRRYSLKSGSEGLRSFSGVITPVDILKDTVAGTGNVMIEPDNDGVYRKVPLLFGANDLTVPNFMLSHLVENKRLKLSNSNIYIDNERIELDNGYLHLRFFTDRKPFKHIPAANVLAAYIEEMEGGDPTLTMDFFDGKTVFIGPTAAGLYDLKPTSVSSLSTGVLVHATALDNILNRSFLVPVPVLFPVMVIVMICILSSMFVLRHASTTKNLAFLLISITALLVAGAMLFRTGFYMNVTSPFSALILSFIVTSAYSYATEGKERRFIKNTFSQYMDNKVVEHILEHPELIHPGGQKKEISLFFADIAGFTTMAERLPPQETAKILHTALNAFTEVIIGHGGVIDKYMGDAIMAFWGSPLATADDNRNSCLAAIQCSKALDEINEEFRNEGLSEINVRIGLHSGEALVGNLGSDRLFDYTAIGDNVNLASRLEGVNKVFKTRIIASEDTLKGIDDQFLTRGLGLIEVKGKALPVRIFELISEKGEADTDVEKMVTLYEKGVSRFMEKQWQEAISIFDEVEMISPGDGPSSYYRAWCTELSALSELTDDWNIIKMTVK